MPQLFGILHLYPTPVVTSPCEVLTEFDQNYLTLLKGQMESVMCSNNGRGLSANQIGVPLRVILVETDKKKEPVLMINPVVTPLDLVRKSGEEGCLSLPGITAKNIERFIDIQIDYQDIKGNRFVGHYIDGVARCILHEMDHISGLTILDRVGKIQKDLLLRKYSKIKKRIKLYQQIMDKK